MLLLDPLGPRAAQSHKPPAKAMARGKLAELTASWFKGKFISCALACPYLGKPHVAIVLACKRFLGSVAYSVTSLESAME